MDSSHLGLELSLFASANTYLYSPFSQVDAVRVYVNSSSENLQYPVLFVVRQQKGVLSWQVPLIFRGL